jgi:hypothetical protein
MPHLLSESDTEFIDIDAVAALGPSDSGSDSGSNSGDSSDSSDPDAPPKSRSISSGLPRGLAQAYALAQAEGENYRQAEMQRKHKMLSLNPGPAYSSSPEVMVSSTATVKDEKRVSSFCYT